ncbi:MAG: glycosyltransferase family 2 protein [Deltaproteobacteria bacterium]|nr:glycosyltransferase family 2 protein [Deltaproteobacteria bacterium]
MPAVNSSFGPKAPVVADPRSNPWPCERCGKPIEVAPVPAAAMLFPVALLTVAALLLVLGVSRRHAGIGWDWLLAVLVLVLTTALDIRRRTGRIWRCGACGLAFAPRLFPATPPSILVAIPTYNNAASIADVVGRVLCACDSPLLVVDDGSTDRTGALALDRVAAAERGRCDVVRHADNRGKGAALQTALAYAHRRRHSHVISLDGDGQHYPEDLPLFVQAIQERPAALIVGSRDLSGANVTGASRFGRRFSNFWLRLQAFEKLADSQSGFRAYPVAPVLSLPTRSRRFAYEVEVLTLAARAQLPIHEIPIRVHYPPPASRVSHFDKLWDNVRISWANTWLLALWPLWWLGFPARLSRRPPPSPVERPWSGQSRGGALGHLIFLALIRRLGLWPAYLLLYPVALYFVFASRTTLRLGQVVVDLVLGAPQDGWRRFDREFRHVMAFSEAILDRAISQARGTDDFTWEAQGAEHLQPKGERGLLLLSGHLGNYEIGGARLAHLGRPVSVVMLDLEAERIKRVYARLESDRPLPDIIAVNRTEFPALRILRALCDGGIVALHGDRVTDGHWVWCDFLGRKAAFPVNAFVIAAAARVPVVLTFGFKVEARRYRFIAEPPREIVLPRGRRAAALHAHAQWYADRLAQYARAYPLQWFNYYDFFATPAAPQTVMETEGGVFGHPRQG